MHIHVRNVNDAFRRLVAFFSGEEYAVTDYPVAPPVKKSSRNGPVLMLEEPFTITYERPTERVLFNTVRDANPAFHLYESLWMIAGRNDVAPLSYYNSKIQQFSDDGNVFNGAYGYRWRRAFNSNMAMDQPAFVDQLDLLVAHLKDNPTSRRAVLQMWNIEDDLLKIGLHPDRAGNLYHPSLAHPPSKDVCCNLSVLFSLRETNDQKSIGNQIKLPGYGEGWTTIPQNYVLDMTVFNRSNDMIWGMLGANYVHFSVLQEYMAAQLGVEVGRYNQISNNLHVYESNWKPEEWLSYYGSDDEVEYVPACNVVPLVKDPAAFDEQLPKIVSYFDGSGRDGKLTAVDITEPFLWDVARPMLTAFARHKRGKTEDALKTCDEIEADDWRVAATQWLQRRMKK